MGLWRQSADQPIKRSGLSTPTDTNDCHWRRNNLCEAELFYNFIVTTMLRQHLSRSVRRSTTSACNAARTFATSSRREAEVQLTIGTEPLIRDSSVGEQANCWIRWKTGLHRRYICLNTIRKRVGLLTLPQLDLLWYKLARRQAAWFHGNWHLISQFWT